MSVHPGILMHAAQGTAAVDEDNSESWGPAPARVANIVDSAFRISMTS